MAKQMRSAKRANRPNPREDRNIHYLNTATKPDTVSRSKKIQIIPRNLAQESYLDLLEDENNDVVFAMGPAGTGKTMLATLYALQQYQLGNIKKIIITRPAVSTDESLGFLPGSLTEKLAPWCRPVIDLFHEYYSPMFVEKMIESTELELASLGMMRGRTFKNAIVILDESQNCTPNQMKMVLTRLGDNSRMFVTGDINQFERGYGDNGLKDFIERLDNYQGDRIKLITFDKKDVERHPVIDEVLTLYGE